MKIEIRETIPEHVRELGRNLREGDRNEIEVYGFPTNRALWRSYKGSILRRTALIDGEVAAIWGVGGVPLSETGQPFLMTSNAVEKVSPLRFVRIYQEQVLCMLRIFPHLVNYVDAAYNKAVRLLDVIGFTLGDPEPIGPHGAMFRKFEMRA